MSSSDEIFGLGGTGYQPVTAGNLPAASQGQQAGSLLSTGW